jgi:hypothetical protein
MVFCSYMMSQICKNYEKELHCIVRKIHDTIIIFEQYTAVIEIHKNFEEDVFRIEDPRLDDPSEWQNPVTFFPIFLENMNKALLSDKSVILMNYNPAVAICLNTLLEICSKNNSPPFVCFIFFHNDEETYHTHVEGVENLLDAKFNMLVSLLDYPFIRKYEVPFGYKITFKYIISLIRQHLGLINLGLIN